MLLSKEKCTIEEGISGLPPGTLINYVELEGLCALQPSAEALWLHVLPGFFRAADALRRVRLLMPQLPCR